MQGGWKLKRNGSDQKRSSQGRKMEKLVGWGEPTEVGSSLQEDISGWKTGATTTTRRASENMVRHTDRGDKKDAGHG